MKYLKSTILIALSIAFVSCSAIPKKSPCGALNQKTDVLAFAATTCGELKSIN